MENTSFFQGLQREYVQMVPKWLEGPFVHISRPKTSLGYKNFSGKLAKNEF